MENFNFKKQFGQNFIFDKNFLNSLLDTFSLPNDVNVVEIGAGMGTLSECLAGRYKKVLSFEIDKTLTEKLKSIEENNPNLKFIFKDILEQSLDEIDEYFCGENYYMIANLPYYITSQIIFKFLLYSQKLNAMYVMVQKEVGERFCSLPNSREYGIPSVVLPTFASCKIVKNVSRKMFTPQPNVDSCIIKIEIQRDKFDIKNAKNYSDFVSKCFNMKRKTLLNNLTHSSFDKDLAIKILNEMSLPLTIRPENLSPDQYVILYNKLS